MSYPGITGYFMQALSLCADWGIPNHFGWETAYAGRVLPRARAPPSDLILTSPQQNQIGGTRNGIQLPSRTEKI